MRLVKLDFKRTLAAMAVAVCLAGCSSESNRPAANQPAAAPQPAAKSVETELGRAAFQKTYISAHFWAPDSLPYLEQSQPTKGATGKDGRSAVWTGSFGSAAKGLAKTFTWSGSDEEGAPSRGITPSAEDSFSSSNASTHTFDLAFLKAESDQAFKVAQEHGG